jgi:hypothetical protein
MEDEITEGNLGNVYVESRFVHKALLRDTCRLLFSDLMNGFEFEVVWNDIHALQLRVAAGNGSFSGTALVYVSVGGLHEAAVKLEGFPRAASDKRELLFGTLGMCSAGGAVRMRFYCKGLAAHSFVETWVESEFDNSKIAETAHFHVKVEANAIDTFVAGLRQLESSLSGVARLAAE